MRFWKMCLLSALFAAAVLGVLIFVVYRERATQAPTRPISSVGIVQVSTSTPELGSPGTYVDADYGFSVTYPETVVPTADTEAMATMGYIPVCDPELAIVCFPYGKEEYAGKNFESAAFAVHDRTDLKDETACAKPQPEEQADGNAVIGGLTFRKYSFGDAAVSHQLTGENYRRYQDGTCFELSTRTLTTTFEVWEPGSIERFTDADRMALQRVLEDMLLSFRFDR